MAKQLNKHTPDSDELFNRLESKDSEGLDDFEKEALEGFASLENDELARSLNSKLNSKIDEVYFEKKSGNKTIYYLSMAAGLILIIGLSVLFYSVLGNQKDELALNKEAIESEKLPGLPNTPGNASPNIEVTSLEKSAETQSSDQNSNEQQNDITAQPNKTISSRIDEGAGKATGSAKGDMLASTTVSEKDDNKPNEINNGPETAAPVALEEKYQAVAKAEESEYSKMNTGANKDLEDAKARSAVSTGGVNKTASKKESKRKEKNMAPGEAVASDDRAYPSATSIVNTKSSAVAYDMNVSAPCFKYKNFNRAQDYIQSEIKQNEKLKANVKEFVAKITINETGKVTKIKFLNSFSNCSECELLLENILLNMPNWVPAINEGKTVKETIHFVYP